MTGNTRCQADRQSLGAQQCAPALSIIGCSWTVLCCAVLCGVGPASSWALSRHWQSSRQEFVLNSSNASTSDSNLLLQRAVPCNVPRRAVPCLQVPGPPVWSGGPAQAQAHAAGALRGAR